MSASRMLKCVVVGDSCVGKTAMVARMVGKHFDDNYVPTVVDTTPIDIMYNGECVTVMMMDTAGQEEYDRLRKQAYRGANVFLLCFALDDVDSYDSVRRVWLPELSCAAPGVPVILCGMKLDLVQNGRVRVIDPSECRPPPPAFARYVECSGLTGQGIQDVLWAAVAVVLEPPVQKSRRKRRWKLCSLM